VNRLSASASNRSKPYQAEVIRTGGFSVPETLITTDPTEAREFCARTGEVIYKSMSSHRSIVSRITAGHADRFAAVTSCPTQFQRRVPGVDVRVHVIGDDIFACEIQADPSIDDYRYPGDQPVRRVPTELDPDVADRCRALAQLLGLPVAGIDLRRTPAGEWFCFEVNPSPGFTAFDDGRIARRLAELLAAGRN
jgi:glutathione synthase/RimK-type ligase-like ATP-grasp enzyme